MNAFWDDLAEDMQDPEYANAHIAALLDLRTAIARLEAGLGEEHDLIDPDAD